MRDPKRIDEIIEELRICWKKYPDLRFGQLVYCLNQSNYNGDIFNPEDDKWLKWIKEGLNYE
ncbi:MAG TPA: hypothetical protein VIK72_09400 [Clostridiaceae bacterium]